MSLWLAAALSHSSKDTSVELAIQTEHLTKIFGGRVIAVNDMTLSVPTGAIYGLLGPRFCEPLDVSPRGFLHLFGLDC